MKDQPIGKKSNNDYTSNRCGYCKMKLDPFFYFCLGCGTPYRRLEDLLPSMPPPVLTEGEMIRRKAPVVWPMFWSYCVVVLVCSFVVAFFDESGRAGLGLLICDLTLFVTTCIFGAAFWRSLAAQFRQFGFNRLAAWSALALLVPLLGINFAYHSLLESVFSLEGSMWWDQLSESGVSRMSLIFSFCVLPALTEEVAFRGLIQHWLATAIKPVRALWLSSFLFAALHFSVLSFPYLFMVGLLLGWAKWKSRSLYPCFAIHFLHNYFVLEFT
jgi:membrane protease YdiL (CAAX protease family)